MGNISGPCSHLMTIRERPLGDRHLWARTNSNLIVPSPRLERKVRNVWNLKHLSMKCWHHQPTRQSALAHLLNNVQKQSLLCALSCRKFLSVLIEHIEKRKNGFVYKWVGIKLQRF